MPWVPESIPTQAAGWMVEGPRHGQACYTTPLFPMRSFAMMTPTQPDFDQALDNDGEALDTAAEQAAKEAAPGVTDPTRDDTW